ncbi:hypothetical protein [Lentzea sp.]|uniref:hypothetical protein n=1 Tax=Lentzea sp. TaxID=56099 RepID=UPI002C235EB0|nr:hypothetical protein [Lentzea sp.]HUQ59075.1 hypothetical protein [Lentzea sp.]
MPKAWSLAAVALLAACQSTPAQPSPELPEGQPFADEQARSPVLGLEFWVHDVKAPMRTRAENGHDEVQTQIGRGEFEVRFPKRSTDVALRMISWTDRTIFALEPGQNFMDVAFLRPGTGMPDKMEGRMTLLLDAKAQNYYAGKRVQRHSDDQEKVLFQGVEERSDLKVDALFVIAVMDFNENETVDPGEYEYFDVRLPG